MARGLKLSRQDVRDILELLDAGISQVDVAKEYGVTPSTISRYNREERLRLKIHDYAGIIADQNLEILELKEQLSLPMSYKVPENFQPAIIYLRINDEIADKIKANKVTRRSIRVVDRVHCNFKGLLCDNEEDAERYIARHPEFHHYIIQVQPNGRFQIKSDCRTRISKHLVSLFNIDYIDSLNGVNINNISYLNTSEIEVIQH